ncbi:MAG: peptide chain release factor N(5)-glutamine methyltransferase [Lachnospiraceae bacterium]|nr:peptide chain release factor N(5)-glutamine methyltransferase [Lachnospiraceae bacterium]
MLGKGTWGELLAAGKEKLKEAGVAEYDLDAWYLFEHAFGISRMQYFLCSGEQAGPGEEAFASYESGLSRRSKREPLQHILGTQEFMGLEFTVSRHVLIPRQDTEILVETVLSAHKEKNISVLDMCTGSGCIGISLAVLGGYRHVEAADISEEALVVARANAAGIPGAGNVCFRQSDLFSEFSPETDRYDVIVSNPPYIPSSVIEGLEPEVRDFEPRNALDGAEDGLLFYRRLAEECGRFLKKNGSVYFEIGYDQGEAVSSLLRSHGFKDTEVIKDLAGKDRVVCGRWQTA